MRVFYGMNEQRNKAVLKYLKQFCGRRELIGLIP